MVHGYPFFIWYLVKMESIQWSNGRLRPRLGRQPRPAPKSTQSTRRVQGLTETPRPHVTQTPRKRQRALTNSKLARYNQLLGTANAT